MVTVSFLKVLWVVLYYLLLALRMHNACPENKLLEFQKMIDSQTFSGHRLADMDMIVFEHDVFTNLQCLDLCLRTKQCASIDVKKGNPQKLCRVNREGLEYFLEERNDWTHINIGSQALRKVSLNM